MGPRTQPGAHDAGYTKELWSIHTLVDFCTVILSAGATGLLMLKAQSGRTPIDPDLLRAGIARAQSPGREPSLSHPRAVVWRLIMGRCSAGGPGQAKWGGVRSA